MNVYRLSLFASLLLLGACASNKPVVYPNTHSQSVGQAQLDIDIAQCQQLAVDAGASPSGGKGADVAKKTVRGGGVGAATGAVGGALGGNPGRGALYGSVSGATAGLLHGLLGGSSGPSNAYKTYVGRCLTGRGYDIAGWD